MKHNLSYLILSGLAALICDELWYHCTCPIRWTKAKQSHKRIILLFLSVWQILFMVGNYQNDLLKLFYLISPFFLVISIYSSSLHFESFILLNTAATQLRCSNNGWHYSVSVRSQIFLLTNWASCILVSSVSQSNL